jgi:hypothetical protein
MGNASCCDNASDVNEDKLPVPPGQEVLATDVAAGIATEGSAIAKMPEEPKRWSVTLKKEEGKTLGMGIRVPKDNSTVLVQLIQAGQMVEAFNKDNPDLAIRPTDRVVSVNQADTPVEIVKQLKEAQTLELTFERP